MKNRNKNNNFKRLWSYVKKYKVNLFSFTIIVFIEAFMTIISPFLIAKVIFNLSKANMKNLIYFSLLLLISEAIKHLASYIKSKTQAKLILNSSIDIQNDLAKSILEIESFEMDKNDSGLFVNRLDQDANDLTSIIFIYINTFIYSLTNFSMLFTIFLLNKYIFIYLILYIIIAYLIDNKRLKTYYNKQKEIRDLSEKRTSKIAEVVRSIKDVKVLNAGNNLLNNMSNLNNYLGKEELNINIINGFYDFLINNIKKIFNLFFVIIGIYLYHKNLMNLGVFVVLYNYRNNFEYLFFPFSYINSSKKEFELSATRVFEIIDNKKFTKETFGKHKIANIKGNIKLENIGFAYDKKEILKGINIEIKENEKVAIVGRSGSGKTTILNLITKLYSNYEGEIFIDDYNIKDLEKDSLRNNISLISQNPYIFNMSIKDNLKLVKEEASDKEIEEVCKIAQIHDYIMSLEDKYDALVGENALILSGGEKQRLAIARALLRKSKIILLDEATSALDNKTQEEIIRAINNLKGNHTVVIVAHRLSTIVDSDKIYVLDDGKIIAKGDHKSLIKSCKLYKNLYEKINKKDD